MRGDAPIMVNGLPTLVYLLNYGDSEIFEIVCSVLETLAFRISLGAEAVNSFPLERIVSLSLNKNQEVRKQSLHALGCLSGLSEEASRAVMDVGVMDMARNLLETGDTDTLEWTCDLLNKLARHDSLKTKVAQSVPYAPIFAAVERTLSKSGMSVLLLISGGSLSCVQACASESNLRWMCKMLDSQSTSIVAFACRILGNVAQHDYFVESILQLAPCQRLVSLAAHTDPNVASAATYALSEISWVEAGMDSVSNVLAQQQRGETPAKTAEVLPSPAEEDDNISMPWNFQHNVHVDEGFTGLPPSWTTALQEAGFSDEEIAAILQRRLADRPRAQSPAAVVRPVPRSTLLPRNQQDQHTPASSLSASSTSSSPTPDLPGSQYSSTKIEFASPKVDYASPKTGSVTEPFGRSDHDEDDIEDWEDEYEYGYEFVEDDREKRGIAGKVESPNAGVGGYGSAFGSPSAAPAGYGYGGSSERASAEPRWQEEEEEEEDEEGTLGPKQRAALGLAIRDAAPARAQVITARRTSRALLSHGFLSALDLAMRPITPAQRYAGWVAAAVAPLEEFIDEPVDPRDFYDDLQEIAEGESGSVYAAALVPDAPMHKLKLPPLIKARDADALAKGHRVLVAIKFVELNPGGSQKLVDVQRECSLLQGLRCDHVLGLDALYVDLVEDSLWIRMELMERSLADVVGLVDEGLRLQEPRIVARFARDMLQALDSLQKHHIAHRDLRSDNLLLNAEGFLKLADFSNAVGVTPESPLATDVVGVVYWQAPEVRSGSYDPLKIDVWSVGATVWELAEASPPFSDTQQPADRWPPLSDPALYPPSFNDFLRMCSEPAASRPTPGALLETPFVQKACGRPVIVQLLSRCTAIEQVLHAGDVPPDSPP
ncbi:Non-specific serine/threonine protein kinase [Mycena venus]|uniref:Non-specific serine/threonine protein kinase n=1 Tax=Mycena venus TaxID=2733690 RepID=A0A8H6TYX6_9AGAR|nr:Non-specific serine/threonine protein kinase [Mycena venus]